MPRKRYDNKARTAPPSPIGLKAFTFLRPRILLPRYCCLEKTGKPVEYGAIEIDFTSFPEKLRSDILQGQKPLGGLLLKHKFDFISNPQTYFRVESDDHIQNHLQVPSFKLYGRATFLPRQVVILSPIW